MPAYEKLSDKDLLRLLFTEADRLPMDFAKEAISRGQRLIPLLSKIINNWENWTRRDQGWCSTTHACFLMAAIGGKAAIKPLADALFHAVETNNDWVCEDFPAMAGSLGPDALDALKEVASDPMWDWYIRARAMEGMAAIAMRHPEREQEIYSFIAKIAADSEEDDEARCWAGHTLLDAGRREYEDLILSVAESGAAEGCYDKNDVRQAWSAGQNLYWYQHDWLEFYSAEQIAQRQRRWESEAASEKSVPDEPDEGEERENMLSRKGALRVLGPDAGLALRIQEFFDADEELGQESLRKQYGLAMELHAAILRRDNEKGTLFARLKAGLLNPATQAKRMAEAPDAFDLFDIALGRDEILPWLMELPFYLAEEGLPQEGAALAEAWAEIAEAETFLGDRAVILAEAGSRDEALAQIKENARRFPDDARVQIKIGEAFRILEFLPAAEAQYRKVTETAAEDHHRKEARQRLIELLQKTGQTAEAQAMADEDRERDEQARSRWEPHVRQGPKTGRNDPCPCGSGKKYKKCCLSKDAE